MARPRYLQEKDGRYHARLVVPKELRPYIQKTALTKSLSADQMEARRLMPAALAKFQEQLAEARAALEADRKPSPSTPRAGQRLSVRNIAAAHYAAELALDDGMRSTMNAGEFKASDIQRQEDRFRPTYEGLLKEVASGRSPDDQTAAVIGWAIEGFRARGNSQVEFGTPEWRDLARSLAGIQLEVFNRQRERNDGDFTGTPQHPHLTRVVIPDDPLKARILTADSELPLSGLVDQFLAERKPGVQAQHEHRRTVQVFEEFLGEPKPVYAITRQDIHGFKRTLAETPTHLNLRFPGMTLHEAIKANKSRARPQPTLDVKTINDGYLSKLGAFLNWCAKSDIIPDNPASGIKIEAAKKTTPDRLHFSPDDLSRLFGNHFAKQDDEMRWAMLLFLFTGAGPSELAQAKLDGIRTERGILVIAVEEQTKTLSRQRLVPIHSKLKQLGFEAYVAKLRRSQQTHLFPKWYRQSMEAKERSVKNGKNTLDKFFPRFLPKRFNNTYRKNVGITHPKKPFYSFRHTFKTGLALAGVGKDMRDDLCGHEDNSAGAVYVHGFSLEARHEAIEKLVFDGFTLT